jgi:hypothetical protein
MEKRPAPSTGATPSKERRVMLVLDHLLDDFDPGIVSQLDIAELRAHRDRCQETETGLSLGRRMAQGRLDIVMAESQRRAGATAGGDPADLLERLPEVLAQHTRGGGTPRPVRDTELPDFTDDISAALDEILPAEQLGHLADLDDARLAEVIEALRDFEQRVSHKRHELHRIIDDLQEEIVGRYRSGAASVDDLLR